MLAGASQGDYSFTVSIKQKRHDPASCPQQYTPIPCVRTIAVCGVNHVTVYSFSNMVFKSATVNALSALISSSVDTTRFSSCKSSEWWRLTPLRQPWLSNISCNRVHGENRRAMVSAKECAGAELPAAAIYRICCLCDASRLIQERERERS
jgi:hypothetical protein